MKIFTEGYYFKTNVCTETYCTCGEEELRIKCTKCKQSVLFECTNPLIYQLSLSSTQKNISVLFAPIVLRYKPNLKRNSRTTKKVHITPSNEKLTHVRTSLMYKKRGKLNIQFYHTN